MHFTGRMNGEAAGGYGGGAARVEVFSRAGPPSAFQHGDVARFRMPVWPAHGVWRKFRADDIQPRLARIAREHDKLDAWQAGIVLPFHLVGLQDGNGFRILIGRRRIRTAK